MHFHLDQSLEAALQSANWINAYAHSKKEGIWWDIIPNKIHDSSDVLTSTFSLYGGSAGISFFFLHLYQITQDEKWLNEAKQGIDYIIVHGPKK